MVTNTIEIGTVLRPLRRVTRAARTAVSPRTPRPATHRTRLPGQAPRFPALAASLLVARAPRRAPRAPIHVAFALAVLAVLAVVAPEQAAAQTETTFISNTGQIRSTSSESIRATAFTTGTGTYTLSSVAIRAHVQTSGTPTPVVQIYGDTGDNPGTLLATMTNPATLVGDAINVFTAPANTTLAASTTYWVVTSNSAMTSGAGFYVALRAGTDLDSGTAAGWSIGIARFAAAIQNPSWANSGNRIQLQIRGTAQTTTPTPTDTTPPTLFSSQVIPSGRNIQFRFSEEVGGTTATLPPASAFTVTADGIAVTVSGVIPTVTVTLLSAGVSPFIRQGQTVVVTYTDPSTGDDGQAIQDTAGNDAASFTTGVSGVPAVTNNSTLATTVPANWSLKPTGLASGDKFRLLFLSSTTRTATATDIADYNTFVQTRAAAGHADIQAYSAGFRVVGCTAAADARDNTETTYTSTTKGVPIYWLNGAKAADQYEDFYEALLHGSGRKRNSPFPKP